MSATTSAAFGPSYLHEKRPVLAALGSCVDIFGVGYGWVPEALALTSDFDLIYGAFESESVWRAVTHAVEQSLVAQVADSLPPHEAAQLSAAARPFRQRAS